MTVLLSLVLFSLLSVVLRLFLMAVARLLGGRSVGIRLLFLLRRLRGGLLIAFGVPVLLADYLVVEFQAYIRIFVPSHLAQTIFVEFLQSCEFRIHECSNLLLPFGCISCLRHVSEEYHVVSDSRHYFYSTVRQHVDLLYHVLPQVVCHYDICHWRDVVACERLSDVARGYYQVRGIAGVGHYSSFVVEIVVVAPLALYPYHRQSLRDAHEHLVVFRLVAFRCLHERALAQQVFYQPWLYVRHLEVQRIHPAVLHHLLHLVGGEEAVGILVSDNDVHLCAHVFALVRFVERDHRYEDIHQEYDIEHQQY